MATPFERMRTAWAAPDREGELNRVVEVMAAEGVTGDQLDSALTSLLLEIRAAGADDDTEEMINSVGDRLHGWCHEKWHIHTRTDSADPPAVNGRATPTDTPATTDAG